MNDRKACRHEQKAIAAGEEVDLVIPAARRKDLYQAGFAHALQDDKLDRIEYFKLSFREGFRAVKRHMRDARRKAGIIDFPLTGRLKIKS